KEDIYRKNNCIGSIFNGPLPWLAGIQEWPDETRRRFRMQRTTTAFKRNEGHRSLRFSHGLCPDCGEKWSYGVYQLRGGFAVGNSCSFCGENARTSQIFSNLESAAKDYWEVTTK
ncbi:MAG: hypothetical protein ACREP9_02050, partial [Candidatus Dormibacteraceae bacterium]